MAVLVKGAGGPSVDLSEIQALFIVGEDSTTVHLRGRFQGPWRDFVWLLPVPSSSRLEFSHNDIFQRMNERTLPHFYLYPVFWFPEVEITPELFESSFGGEWFGYVPDFPDLAMEIERNEACFSFGDGYFFPIADRWPCVSCRAVYLTRTVESETRATLINARSHSEITDWALGRGYLPGRMDPEVVQSYLDEGNSILAVEAVTGAYQNHRERVKWIQPLAFTYAGDNVTVTLKSAASAGVSRKKLTVWIASEARAVPENYLHVHLNEARLDWMDTYGIFKRKLPGNYYQILSDAIAEAGHQAFATEYAVEGVSLGGPRELHVDLESLRHPKSLDAFMIDLWNGGITPKDREWNEPLSELDLKFVQLLRKHIPVPESVLEEYRRDYNGREEWFLARAESDFYSYPFDYEDHYENEWFNYSGFVDDWITYIQEPNSRTHQAIAQRSYLTRLTTFFFSDAKTVDPVFVFNPDLGQVNHIPNVGILSFECSGGEKERYDESDIIPVVGLEGGTILRFGVTQLGDIPITRYGPSEFPPPASGRIEQLSASGRPVIVRDRRITRTVVEGTVPERVRTVEFSNMSRSPGPRYIWSTITRPVFNSIGSIDSLRSFERIISSGDQAGVSGCYRVRSRGRDGTVVGQWHIALAQNQRQIFELIPGERARVVAVEPLDAAKEIASTTAPNLSGLNPNAPNPFNSRTVLSWFLNTPGPVRLEIYNTLGQRVRTLVNEVQAPGRHQVSWDARDQGGAPVAAGVYLSRLKHPGGVQTQRLLYLK